MAKEDIEKIEEAEDDGLTVVKLRKPLEYNGKTYEKLTFDLEGLTGRDSLEVEEELMQRRKGTVIYGALNNDYCLGIAAKACRQSVGTDAFSMLSIKDFNAVKDAVRNFLLK